MCYFQVTGNLETSTAEVEALRSSHRQKQESLEAIIQRQEKMLQAVTNAVSVEEQAKLAVQKQLRVAKDRVTQLDQELTNVMGKLADASDRARDMQTERDDALVR